MIFCNIRYRICVDKFYIDRYKIINDEHRMRFKEAGQDNVLS